MIENNKIAIPQAAQETIIEKARSAVDAVLARDEAVALVMAALSVPADWQIAPDASAFVGPPTEPEGDK